MSVDILREEWANRGDPDQTSHSAISESALLANYPSGFIMIYIYLSNRLSLDLDKRLLLTKKLPYFISPQTHVGNIALD